MYHFGQVVIFHGQRADVPKVQQWDGREIAISQSRAFRQIHTEPIAAALVPV